MKHIITITGASGVGKSTFVKMLRSQTGIQEIISHTTRCPRPGETNGIDYHFIDLETFNSLEKIEQTEYAGNHYCMAVSELDRLVDGQTAIVIVDQHGVDCIEKFVSKHPEKYERISVFLNCSPELSESRMKERGDNDQMIEKRLRQQKERNEYEPVNSSLYKYRFDMCDRLDLTNAINTLKQAIASF